MEESMALGLMPDWTGHSRDKILNLGEVPPWVQYSPDKILNSRFAVVRQRLPEGVKLPDRPWSPVIREWITEKRGPSPDICSPSLLQWVKKWSHIDPPPGGIFTFIQVKRTVPAGTITFPKGIEIRASITPIPNLYTVPQDHVLYVRYVQVLLYDADYESLFVGVMDGNGRARDWEAPGSPYSYLTMPGPVLRNSIAATTVPPLMPECFHNVLIAFDEGHTVGAVITNNHIADRVLWVGIWGWKVRKTCLDEYLMR